MRFPSAFTASLAIAAALWGTAVATGAIPFLERTLVRFEYLTLDARFRLAGARPAPEDVVVVAIDDEAIGAAGAYPLPREVLAKLTRRLAASKPRAIVFDLAFLDAGAPDADRALSEALAAAPTAVAAIARFPEGAGVGALPAPVSILWPIDAIRAASRSGIVNIDTDESGTPRRIPMLFAFGRGVVPSLTLLAASIAVQATPKFSDDRLHLGGRQIDLDPGARLTLRFYGPEGAFRRTSAASLLTSGGSSGDFADRIVVVGATATGVGDSFATPFTRLEPGVEILATGIANLLHGDGLARNDLSRFFDASAPIALSVLVVASLAMRKATAGLSAAFALMAGWLLAAVVAFQFDVWIAVARPLAAVLPVATCAGGGRFVFERVRGARLARENAALGSLQPPRLVEALRRDPGFLRSPVLRDVAVVFLDLAGFTGFAQDLGAGGARAALMEFQTIVEREIAGENGVVVSFMGDGAMAVFGLPESAATDAARALRAMMNLSKAIRNWISDRGDGSKLGVRVVGHFGPAVLSRLGPAHHQNITATGDTVNVASRLIEVAKARKAGLVASESLCLAAGREAQWTAEAIAADVDLRGRVGELRVRLFVLG